MFSRCNTIVAIFVPKRLFTTLSAIFVSKDNEFFRIRQDKSFISQSQPTFSAIMSVCYLNLLGLTPKCFLKTVEKYFTSLKPDA